MKIVLLIINMSLCFLLVSCKKEVTLNPINDYIIWSQLIAQWTFNETHIDEFKSPNSGFQNYINTKTNWNLFYNWNNQYTYSFNEEWKYPTISVTFKNINSDTISAIHEEDIEVTQREWENWYRMFGWVNVPKLWMVWTYNWFSLKKEKDDGSYEYSLLKCWGKEEIDKSKVFPYWTWVIEFTKDHIYAYNNHIETWWIIDASKFFNMIVTTYRNFPNKCVIDIDKISDSKYINELPIKLWDSFSNWVVAILTDNEWNLFCRESSSKDSNVILFTNGDIICGLTIQQDMKFEKLYIK